jgi:uncharacterized protein YwgA
MSADSPHLAAARIIQYAGGELVGRTRLQKIAYLMQLAGLDKEFSFEYHHYGPYSEDLAQAIEIASALGPVKEEERVAEWGGKYSIYKLEKDVAPSDPTKEQFVQQAKQIGAIELELAATAAYLFAQDRSGDPWDETRRLKPSKAEGGRLERAAYAYAALRVATGDRLPALPALEPR